MTLDIQMLAAAFADDPRVLLVTLFGSAQDGTVRDRLTTNRLPNLSRAASARSFSKRRSTRSFPAFMRATRKT